MAEVNTPRVMAAAKEFNIGKDTLVDFLVSKGFEGDDLKPNSKISEEMYRVLQVEFQPDKVAKQKAEQVDLPKNAVTDFKKRRDEQDLSFNKKEPVKAKEAIYPGLPSPPLVKLYGLVKPLNNKIVNFSNKFNSSSLQGIISTSKLCKPYFLIALWKGVELPRFMSPLCTLQRDLKLTVCPT